MKSLHLVRSETGTFSCDVQPDSRNRWCVLVLHPAGQRRDMPARVRLRMEGDPCSSFETFVPAPFGLLGVIIEAFNRIFHPRTAGKTEASLDG